MINTVIFDLGNVLVDFKPMEYLNKLGYHGEMAERMFEAVINNNIWNEFDRGNVEEEEVLAEFIHKTPELEDEIRKVFSNLHGIITKAEYTDQWIDDLKNRGYHVLFLSNLSKKLYTECKDELRFLEKMEGGILSFKVKMIKPDDDIYQKIINDYHLNPKECVFIDDREKNVAAAEKNGLNAVVFEGYLETLSKLKKYNI